MIDPGQRTPVNVPSRAAVAQMGSVVLVVDDSPSTLGMLNATLEAAGYTVLLAQSGSAALALMDRVTPDIVLLDAVMPGLDGFQTCERLKRSRMNADVPVVFMTGLTETEHVVRALDAGGVDYLTKPVVPAELVARIGVHLANARLMQSARAALDTTGRYLLAMDPAGDLVWCTPQAAAWLGAGETKPTDPARPLPDSVIRWALGCGRQSAGCRPLDFHAPRTGNLLEISYVGQISAKEILLRLVRVDHARDEQALRERLNLTAREAEVLLWVSRGKTNRDIADILGMSPRTVNKHLEQVFAKLGVENRAAAIHVMHGSEQ